MKKISRKHQKWILPKGLIVLGAILAVLVSYNCHKDTVTPTPPATVAPVIDSFVLENVSMTSANFSFHAKNYQDLSILVNGKSSSVKGGIFQAVGLSPSTNYKTVLTATNKEKGTSRFINFQTASSKLTVDSLGVKDITTKSATIIIATSSDLAIVSETLTDSASGQVYQVTGKKEYQLTNLDPNTDYSFTLAVKDKSGNEKTKPIRFTTLQKASDWIKAPEVTYDKSFAIDGNAQSSELTIKLTNLSSATKTLKSLTANFGENGVAVKMLRYQLGEARWKVLKATDNRGEIKFTNLELKPGVNVLHTYFSLKPDVGGVDNNAKLALSFTSLDDGESGTLPHEGSFSDSIAVGSVNANAEPTMVINYTYYKGISISTTVGYTAAFPGLDFSNNGMFGFGFVLSGPEGARLYSIHLKNPYAAFTGLVYKPNSWTFYSYLTKTHYPEKVKSYVWETGNQAISIFFPKDEMSKAVTDSKSYNNFDMAVPYKNDSDVMFLTNDYTPGEIGFILDSKYDISILNSDNQIVDLSEVTVYKDSQVYLTD